jgi:phosphoribosylformylglycinamidine synthase
LLLGTNKGEIGGSEYLRLRTGRVHGDAPEIDLQYEKRIQCSCLELAKAGLLKSAHDVSEGGIAVTIAEGCFSNASSGIGAIIFEKSYGDVRTDFWLFGESQSMIITSVSPESLGEAMRICKANDVDASGIGIVTADGTLIFGKDINSSVALLWGEYDTAIERAMA